MVVVEKRKRAGENRIQELIKEQPALTLEEIRSEYGQNFEPVSRSTIVRTLKKLKITRKKKSLFEPRKTSKSGEAGEISRKCVKIQSIRSHFY